MHSKHNAPEGIDHVILEKMVVLEPIEIKRMNSANEAIKEFREKYPPYRLWQFAIDGRLYDPESAGDPQGYRKFEDREPGCLKAYFRGLNRALKNIEDPSKSISIELIQDLHSEACVDVKRLNPYLKPGKFRVETDTCWLDFSMKSHCITLEGLSDLLTKIENGELGETGAINRAYKRGYNKNIAKNNIAYETIKKIKESIGVQTNQEFAEHLMKSCHKCRYYPPADYEIDDLTHSVINHYNNAILSEEIQNDSDKVLQLIGETIQFFQRIHPFPDANGRTFVNLLLNRMLLQNGFPPATYYEPNLFDAFTSNHVAVLKRAMLNTLDIYAGKDIFCFNIDTQFSSDDVNFFKSMSEIHDLYDALSNSKNMTIRMQANKPIKSSAPLPYLNQDGKFFSKKPKSKPGLELENDNEQCGIKNKGRNK